MRFSTGFLFLLVAGWADVAGATSSFIFFAEQSAQSTDAAIPSFFTVKRCDVFVDGSFDKVEFQELMGLYVGAVCTREQFLAGVARVKQKQLVITMKVDFIQEPDGVNLVCHIVCDWVLVSLKLLGISSGKDEYLACYEMQPGDLFIAQMHQSSLQALRDFLASRGYKNAQVVDQTMYDYKHKTVGVTLSLDRGKAFFIKNVVVDFGRPFALFTAADKKKIIQKCTALTGKVCSEETIESTLGSLKKWLHDNGYRSCTVGVAQEVLIDEHAVRVIITVTAAEKKEMIFFGNHFFSDQELQKKVSDAALDGIFLPSLVVAQELEAEYHAKGFWTARVTCTEDVKGQELFVIDEGARVTLKKVLIAGDTIFEKKWLEKTFFTSVIKHFYDQDRLDAACNELLTWYKQQGFWDVAFVKKEYERMPIGAYQYCLHLTVHEGVRRFITKMTMKEDGQEKSMPTCSVIKIGSQPVPLPATSLALEQQGLLKKLVKEGYLHARVHPDIVDTKGEVAVTWDIQKGSRVTFGKTIMSGVTTIQYNRLVALLPYKKGQVWDKEKVHETHAYLHSLDIFDRVAVYPSFKTVVPNERDMIIMLKDDDPFEVKLRMGFAQVSKNFAFKKGSTYKIGGSFIWKNPLVIADRFSVDLDFNRYERRIQGAYKVPLFFRIPVTTAFKVYSNKYIQPVYIGSSKPLYQVLQEGFLVGLNKKIARVDVGMTSGFEWMETTDISFELARAINFDTNLVNKKIPYFFIEPIVYADFLNDKVNPTQGFYGMTALKGMFPFKQSSFLVKLLMEYGTFLSLDPVVLAMRVRGGHIFKRHFDAIMPPERFFLGGPYSLRGYLQDYCPPLGIYIDDDGGPQYVPQGGKTMFNANFELRVPFVQKTVWTALFQDVGILIEDPKAIFAGQAPLAATGFGVRYMTPVGPLRFDIGWKWKKSLPDESSYAWFLTFGNAF